MHHRYGWRPLWSSLALLLAPLALNAFAQTAPSITVRDANPINEGASAVFRVSLSARPTNAVTVVVATSDGTATAGSDYVPITQTLTFPAGTRTLAQVVRVSTINDTLPEGIETFNLNLSNATNATIARTQAIGTIRASDGGAPPPPQATLSIANVSQAEGNAGTSTMTFTVSLSAPAPTGGVSFSFATANGTATAGSDYVATSGTGSIAAGATSTTLPVTINGDTTFEPDETFSVNITGASNTANATTSATGTIVNDDVLPTLSIGNVSQAEGNAGTSTMTFTVSLSSPAPTGGVSFSFATANGTATAGSDYVATSGTGSIAAGATSTTIPVTINGDTTFEPDETFSVNITGATNTANATASATGTIVNDDAAPTRPNVSINSTSFNRDVFPAAKVGEQAQVLNSTTFQVIAINDLGMHCGDLDTRVSSILPPFNVLHAVALQKGARPAKLTEAQVDLRYSAASNANDPILTNPDAILDPNFAGVYKTNFWDIARGAYAPFYPAGFLATLPDLGVDIGLPVPDVERLYLGDGQLAVDQQEMPGRSIPYTNNDPKSFSQHVGTQPFFTSFPFGYTSGVNWFEAAGIPIATFDDFGRENAYPMMRVQAVAKTAIGTAAAGTVLATVDTVIPVSGEADCKACHAHTADGGNGTAVQRLGNNVTVSIEDPQAGSLPLPVSVEWATDKNILRLHDIKHATNLEASSPVVCQSCHYTPALDLAQLGPINDLLGASAEQRQHRSMSSVMHKSHGDLKNNGFPNLFPDMPGPVGRNATTAQNVLNDTCYMCHPGRRVQCMRGAMGQAGVVCQDCHGNMSQVGTDFSRNVSTTNPGAFELAGDFYTNANTPRVPWANEPGCGSCHTGDVRANGRPTAPAGQSYVVATDGIRLLQAYRTGDAKATPIVPTNKRFAEDTTATGNPKLYRVSVGGAAATGNGASGHGGLFCEACHGSTHAEWAAQPTATRANANDNNTPQQLQGHNGVIIECGTCHGTANLGNTLNGPHGMHPVGNGTANGFVNGGHENLAENNPNACRACHGQTGQGSVLSKTKVQRTFPRAANRGFPGGIIPAGTPVTCTMCHGNEL